MSSGRSRRRSGSPPVRRSLRTPRPTKIRARRSISSKVSSSARARNGMFRAVDGARHAVDAAEVAAIGDRDAQIAQRTPEKVLAGASRPASGCAEGRQAAVEGRGRGTRSRFYALPVGAAYPVREALAPNESPRPGRSALSAGFRGCADFPNLPQVRGRSARSRILPAAPSGTSRGGPARSSCRPPCRECSCAPRCPGSRTSCSGRIASSATEP